MSMSMSMSMGIVQNKTQPASRLSATDAFFVAYQQRSGILMQLGGEIELEGDLRREDLEQMISYVVARWPRLGQALQKSLVGLKWKGNCLTGNMLRIGKGSDALSEWRNEPIDPFHEPPFQVLWIPPPHAAAAFPGRWLAVALNLRHHEVEQRPGRFI